MLVILIIRRADEPAYCPLVPDFHVSEMASAEMWFMYLKGGGCYFRQVLDFLLVDAGYIITVVVLLASIPAVPAVRAEREITAVKRVVAVWFQAPCEPAGRVYAGAAGQRGGIMPVRPPVRCRLP